MIYSDKTNNEIMIEIKKIELDHNNIKNKLISLLNELDLLEKNYILAKNELKRRNIT